MAMHRVNGVEKKISRFQHFTVFFGFLQGHPTTLERCAFWVGAKQEKVPDEPEYIHIALRVRCRLLFTF